MEFRRILGLVGAVALLGVLFSAGKFILFKVFFFLILAYGVLYLLSLVYRTTGIVTALIGLGAAFSYPLMTMVGFYLLYLTLNIMFTKSILLGLIILILGLPVMEVLLYATLIALGFPLLWMMLDLQNRFASQKDETIDVSFRVRKEERE